MIRCLLIFFLLVLLGGCAAAPPRKELQAARMAVAQAQYAGAAEWAPEEFAGANAALMEGEKLVREGEYGRAKAVLPRAEDPGPCRPGPGSPGTGRTGTCPGGKTAAETAGKNTGRKTGQTPSSRPSPVKPKPAPEPPPQPPLTAFTVGENQTLWTIAGRKDIYDDPLLWPLLYQANRDQIKDPRQIYPGQLLNIPRDLFAEELAEAREKARKSDIFPAEQLLKGIGQSN